jgi:hypothetical protein
MRALLIAIVIALTSAQARAETDDDTKSASTATWLSVGGAAAAYIGMAESTRITDTATGATRTAVLAADVAGWIVLPSLGHFYSDDWHPTGLAIRAAGIGAVALGVYADRSCEDEPCGGSILILGGALAVVGGTIYDIATASGAAHEYNRAHHVSIAPTVLSPPSGPVMGIGVGGEF